MVFMRLFEPILKPLVERKAETIAGLCAPHVGASIVDVGAGRALIAKRILEKTGAKITCVDIDDLNETNLSREELLYVLYDGKTLPFPDNTFETALLVYVLHHCNNQEEILDEVMRVSKRAIIFEDLGPYPLTQIGDFIVNTLLHGVYAPLKFRRDASWKELFAQKGFRLVEAKYDVEKNWYYPIKHVMYIIEK